MNSKADHHSILVVNIKTMGSRPEVNQFIKKMTDGNMKRLQKLNKNNTIFNDAYGPFAYCNRKLVNNIEQDEVQLKAYQKLIHYVAKVFLKFEKTQLIINTTI